MNCMQCGETISHGLFCSDTCGQDYKADTSPDLDDEEAIENPMYAEPEETVDGGEWAEQHDRMD